jgi:hypothetical protein
MEDFDLDLDSELDDLDLDGEMAADLERSLVALERRGGVEAAFRAVMAEELGDDGF